MLPARRHWHRHHHQHQRRKNLSLNLHYDCVCMFVCVRARHMPANFYEIVCKSHCGNRKKNAIVGGWVSQWNRFMIFFCHFGATMIFYVNVCAFLQHQRQQRLQQRRRRWRRHRRQEPQQRWWWWRRDQLQCENEIIKLLAHHNRITHGVFALLPALLPLSLIKSYLIFWYPLSHTHTHTLNLMTLFSRCSWLELLILVACGTRTSEVTVWVCLLVCLFVVQYSKLRATKDHRPIRSNDARKWCEEKQAEKSRKERTTEEFN